VRFLFKIIYSIAKYNLPSVSENQVFDAKPGTLFTHRNIANQFSVSDPNINSVLAYAVAALKVKHVIVMGHYGCGGALCMASTRDL
jgi:carbonic anhydrase